MYTFRRRPGLAPCGTFDRVSVDIVALTRLKAAPDGRVILVLVIKHRVLRVEVDTPVLVIEHSTPVLEGLLAMARAWLQQSLGR